MAISYDLLRANLAAEPQETQAQTEAGGVERKHNRLWSSVVPRCMDVLLDLMLYD